MKPSLAAVLLSGALVGCISMGFEAEVYDRRPFTPPPMYQSWWSSTRSCSELDGDMDRITWFTASGIEGDQLVARGRWSQPHDIIIVRGYEEDEKTVRHEMLHDLLDGDRMHGAAAWAECDLLSG